MRWGSAARSFASSGLTPVTAGDTAGAAREVSQWGDPTKAAFAPALAAEIYGLDILMSDVEDEKHNTTRFIVLSRGSELGAAAHRGRRSPRSSFASATFLPRSTRRSAASPPMAST